MNLKKRTYTEFEQAVEPETKSRSYNLTKTTKIYDFE